MNRNVTPFPVWLPLACGLLWPQVLPAAPEATLPPISVRVLPGTDPSVINDLENVRPVKGSGPAALQLDFAHKRILNAQGQIVIESDGKNLMYLQGTVDKWRYVESLRAIAAAHPQEMHIEWGNVPQAQRAGPMPWAYEGEAVSIVVTNVSARRQLVLFNLAANGILNILAVRESNKPGELSGDTVSIEAVAQRNPFGADHLIAVSAADPSGMHDFIGWLAETTAARGMVDTRGVILKEISALKDVRVGVQAIYTCHSLLDCNR